jgi:hypothetical protein
VPSVAPAARSNEMLGQGCASFPPCPSSGSCLRLAIGCLPSRVGTTYRGKRAWFEPAHSCRGHIREASVGHGALLSASNEKAHREGSLPDRFAIPLHQSGQSISRSMRYLFTPRLYGIPRDLQRGRLLRGSWAPCWSSSDLAGPPSIRMATRFVSKSNGASGWATYRSRPLFMVRLPHKGEPLGPTRSHRSPVEDGRHIPRRQPPWGFTNESQDCVADSSIDAKDPLRRWRSRNGPECVRARRSR